MSKVSRGVGNWLREDFDLAPAGNHIALNLNEYLKRHRVCLNQGLKQEEEGGTATLVVAAVLGVGPPLEGVRRGFN